MKSTKASKKTASSVKKVAVSRKAAPPKTGVKAVAQKTGAKGVSGKTAPARSKTPAAKAVKAAASRKASAKPKAATVKKTVKLTASAANKASAKIEKPSSATPVKHIRLNARQKDSFKNLLLTMRERLSASIKSLKSESLATKDWVNLEEDGTDIFDQQFALNIVSSENEMLIQIDEALSRLEANEYGLCEDCECVINTERLKALPFAKTCIACQSQKEGRGRFNADSIMDGFE